MHHSRIVTPFEKRRDWFCKKVYILQHEQHQIRIMIDSFTINRGGSQKARENYTVRILVSVIASNSFDMVNSKSRGRTRILDVLLASAGTNSFLARCAAYYGFDLNLYANVTRKYLFAEEFDDLAAYL
jgi:hypothetical protein